MRNARGRITAQRALDALRVLADYGIAGRSRMGFGRALGLALSKCDVRANQMLNAAGELLEDQNHHLTAAIVRSLVEPRNAQVFHDALRLLAKTVSDDNELVHGLLRQLPTQPDHMEVS